MSKISKNQELRELLDIRIVEILEAHNLLSVKKLEKKTDEDLLALPKFGPRALSQVKEILEYVAKAKLAAAK